MSPTASSDRQCSPSGPQSSQLLAVCGASSLALFGMPLLAVRQIQRHTIARLALAHNGAASEARDGRRALAGGRLPSGAEREALGPVDGRGSRTTSNNLRLYCRVLRNDQRAADESISCRVTGRYGLRTGRGARRKVARAAARFRQGQPMMMATIDLNKAAAG